MADRFVSVAGSGSNTGLDASNEWTMAQATANAAAGNIHHCKAGTYIADDSASSSIMDIDVAGGVPERGDIQAVVAVSRRPARRDIVLKPPQLIERGHPQRLGVVTGVQPHRPVERPLVDAESAIGLEAHHEELARLVGAEREADAMIRHPGSEMARAGDGEFDRGVGRLV